MSTPLTGMSGSDLLLIINPRSHRWPKVDAVQNHGTDRNVLGITNLVFTYQLIKSRERLHRRCFGTCQARKVLQKCPPLWQIICCHTGNY